MKVGFDAKRLFHNHTGLGSYSRLLVKGLSKIDSEIQILLFAKNPKESRYYDAFKQLTIISSSKLLWRSWRMKSDILRHGCDIYHGLSHELPVGIHRNKIKTVVTIHDVIFKIYPELYPWFDRGIYHQKWKYSCEVADAIVVVSTQTKTDLAQFYNVDEAKIHLIPPPVDMSMQEIDIAAFRKKNLLPEHFFLYVGALSKRKNVSLIIQAMALSKAEDRVPLVIIGNGAEKETLSELISAYGLTNLIIFRNQVTNEELAHYYQAAEALIYPSLYEGFGIPLVESLQNRTPVITSNISSMPEAAGPGAILIDPHEPEQLAQAMTKILDQPDLTSKLSQDGYQYSLQFTPEEVCKKQIRLYDKLLQN